VPAAAPHDVDVPAAAPHDVDVPAAAPHDVDVPASDDDGSEDDFQPLRRRLRNVPARLEARVRERSARRPQAAASRGTAAAPLGTCAVCLLNDVTKIAIPCGHAHMCEACCSVIMAAAVKRCPTCRNEIIYAVTVFIN
jgi:hypothetical protein